jgi:hypothetical protein
LPRWNPKRNFLPHCAKKAILSIHAAGVAVPPARPHMTEVIGNMSNCVLPCAQTDSGLPGYALMIWD